MSKYIHEIMREKNLKHEFNSLKTEMKNTWTLSMVMKRFKFASANITALKPNQQFARRESGAVGPWAAGNPRGLCSLPAGSATRASPPANRTKIPVALRHMYVWFKIPPYFTAGYTKVLVCKYFVLARKILHQREGGLRNAPWLWPDEDSLGRPFLGVTQQLAFTHWTRTSSRVLPMGCQMGKPFPGHSTLLPH